MKFTRILIYFVENVHFLSHSTDQIHRIVVHFINLFPKSCSIKLEKRKKKKEMIKSKYRIKFCV